MSHNPNRGVGNSRRKRHNQRRYSGGGIKKSREVSAILGQELSNRVATDHGFKVDFFSGKGFDFFYELISANNTTGVVQNAKGDMAIHVLNGCLWVRQDGDEFIQLSQGQSASFPRGMKYEMATVGNRDAEIIVAQSPKYAASVKQVSGDVVKTAEHISKLPVKKRRVGKSNPEAALVAAEKIKAQRMGRAQQEGPKKRAPLDGQQIKGANPQPVGASGYAE
jgi:hypothetical protein